MVPETDQPDTAGPVSFMAKAETRIYASRDRVWEALVQPDRIRKYMFGAEVVSDWKEGSLITWKGEWQGRRYEDRGIIRRLEPERLLQYSH